MFSCYDRFRKMPEYLCYINLNIFKYIIHTYTIDELTFLNISIFISIILFLRIEFFLFCCNLTIE